MRTRGSRRLLFVLLAPAAGCASTGMSRTDTTTASMAGLETFLTDSKGTISGTVASLEQISKTATTNPRPAYQEFCGGVAKIEAAAEKARERSIAIKARAKEHHDRWFQELQTVQSEDVRKTGEAQRAKALEAFQRIDTQMGEVKTAYEPFIGLLKDIQVYLANDLNPSGIKAVGSQVTQAASRGHDVESKIDRLVAEISKVRKEIEIPPGVAQPASGYR